MNEYLQSLLVKPADSLDSMEKVALSLEWYKLQEKANLIANKLEASTVQAGETLTVGQVRVTYSKGGRGTNDHEAAAIKGIPADELDALVAEHTETVTTTTVDWKAICAHKNLKPIYTPSPKGPSAKIKLLS